MGIEKRIDVEHQDVEDHRPLTRAEKAEVKRYGEAKEKREIIAGYRERVDDRK